MRHVITFLIVLIYGYGCIWVFNHVNAWLSFAALFVGVLAFYYIFLHKHFR